MVGRIEAEAQTFQIFQSALRGHDALLEGADIQCRRAPFGCRQHLPVFMLPRLLQWVKQPLPRSPNGKLDRQRWMQDHGSL